MSRTAVSKHLRVLADAGLVHERKVGRETRYRLDTDPLLELKRWVSYFDRFWENSLSQLKYYVESDEVDPTQRKPQLAKIELLAPTEPDH
ncbi:HTH-type transcriptional regulator [compost metagenome]